MFHLRGQDLSVHCPQDEPDREGKNRSRDLFQLPLRSPPPSPPITFPLDTLSHIHSKHTHGNDYLQQMLTRWAVGQCSPGGLWANAHLVGCGPMLTWWANAHQVGCGPMLTWWANAQGTLKQIIAGRDCNSPHVYLTGQTTHLILIETVKISQHWPTNQLTVPFLPTNSANTR